MDNLLSSKAVAAVLGTTARTAKDILMIHGLRPINIGRGRKPVYRWLESAVQQFICSLQKPAPRTQSKKSPKSSKSQVDISTISIDDLYNLTLTKDTPRQ